MKTNKKGISLIVLVITIIVMIILAAAIILSLNNARIINKANQAVEWIDLAQVKHLATLAWSDAYLDGKTKQADLKLAVNEALKGINTSKYTIKVTEKGVDVAVKMEVPNKWRENIMVIEDTVPIPKGFVASPYDGENTKDGGLVIYELHEDETAIPETETHQVSLTTRNQYVWIPVEDFSKFVRGSYDNTTYSNVLGVGYWEVVLNTTTNMPETSQDSNYVTNATLDGGITNTLVEVQAVYESVKEYKGFYIARYEAGIDTQRIEQGTAANLPRGTSVYSRMNKIPYTYIPWTWNNATNEDTNGAVEVARSIYPVTNTNCGVVSTLTYGVQWDAILNWWLDVNAKDINGNEIDVNNSLDYGNYLEHAITEGSLNEGAKYAVFDMDEYTLGPYQTAISTSTKSTDKTWALSTGALKAAKVNNIYDMAGNLWEWTLEGNNRELRVNRGGSFTGGEQVAGRSSYLLSSTTFHIGFRSALYIKK